MALLDSDPTAKELFDNALNNPGSNALTNSDTPSETWPFHGIHAYVGGDAGLIGKELNINAETNAPSQLITWTGLGAGTGVDDVFPVASVWAGAPQGTPWNIPTAAIQNAAGKYVAPSETAAAASEADATMDPTTNLVTFAANANDMAAYNNYLMVESYLVVPTSGLAAAKAQKLAQYIRFVVGSVAAVGRQDLGVGSSDSEHGGRRPEGGDRAGWSTRGLRCSDLHDLHDLRVLHNLHNLDHDDHGAHRMPHRDLQWPRPATLGAAQALLRPAPRTLFRRSPWAVPW